MDQIIAKHLFFTGHVQGVGFRRTTKNIASNYQIYGFVKNRSDGRVELWVEGNQLEVNNFLDKVKETFKTYIGFLESQDVVVKNYRDFSIQH